ncbi:sulfite exporter TauE/SafE family protein [Occallatibacter riparius]|uniref:Probable membrane transporter protein n=1 Tax=Occallatibacter riparius TaxID=1002689 RepID=A0A9J7BFH8_9BACT|nr:sulfite exporter TauE/SafE family protein [Occallatibacter riparius]UWZ81764.1 sulfite exporter TauE/SafE family protein [Occallatibacter riparius]
MTVLTFTVAVWAISLLAGFLGALTGLGGGVVVVPALTILLGVDIKYAIGASLVSVIATSSGAAAAYVREGFSNVRIGMFLEIATTIGAIAGAWLAAFTSTHIIAIVFGVVLIQSAWQSLFGSHHGSGPAESDALGARLRLAGDYPENGQSCEYGVRNVKTGFSLMFGAGALSGLLGIGSGAVKVIAMDRAMRIPFKVSTTTSNFMIGVTAAASAGVYLSRGYIDPRVAMPVMLGVLAGAFLGSKVLVHAPVRTLRIVFGVVILVMAIEMIINGITGKV